MSVSPGFLLSGTGTCTRLTLRTAPRPRRPARIACARKALDGSASGAAFQREPPGGTVVAPPTEQVVDKFVAGLLGAGARVSRTETEALVYTSARGRDRPVALHGDRGSARDRLDELEYTPPGGSSHGGDPRVDTHNQTERTLVVRPTNCRRDFGPPRAW